MTNLDEIKAHYRRGIHICAVNAAPYARDTLEDFQWLIAEIERLQASNRAFLAELQWWRTSFPMAGLVKPTLNKKEPPDPSSGPNGESVKLE